VVHYLASFLAGYFIGSVPTAYLLVKQKTGIDIQQAGSGNVGALNVFSVTRSKLLAILVGLLDGLKGFAVAWIMFSLLEAPVWVGLVGVLGSILGHNYPLWLQFKGGRGLATAAGGFLAIGVGYAVVWCLSWLAFNQWKKDVVTANVLCSMFTPLVLVGVPDSWLRAMTISPISVDDYRLFSGMLSVLLLVSHHEVIRRLLQQPS
jgi:glycerol-3-phosphate acyltransferase PlsY